MTELSYILIVEDNQDDYEATLRSFKKNRFMNPIKWCKNGKEALDLILPEEDEEHTKLINPNIILLDLNMPGINGREVLKVLKSYPKTRSIPVIILTTSADEKDIEHCYQLGASTYIQKPVSFEGLTEAIKKIQDYWFGIAILPKQINSTSH
ncbi:response regulator [Sessilibacter sp. MAH4]